MLKKVAFILPYWGALPPWSILFIRSVALNPNIDVLFLCDADVSFIYPENFKVIPLNKVDFRGRVQRTLNLQVGDFGGHKLCDFRPFFGLIFADLISDYDFWGFCDLDMMFGDLSKLFNSSFFSHTDIFSACDQQLVGHFTVLRNSDRLNQICFGIPNWNDVLLDVENKMLDEIPFYNAICRTSDLRFVQPSCFDDELDNDFSSFGVTFGFAGEIAYSKKMTFSVAYWNAGSAFIERQNDGFREVLYIHFMGLKRFWHWLPLSASRPETSSDFYFSRIGYGYIENISQQDQLLWRCFYLIQINLVRAKFLIGSFLRKLLPRSSFRAVRKLLLGRSRY